MNATYIRSVKVTQEAVDPLRKKMDEAMGPDSLQYGQAFIITQVDAPEQEPLYRRIWAISYCGYGQCDMRAALHSATATLLLRCCTARSAPPRGIAQPPLATASRTTVERVEALRCHRGRLALRLLSGACGRSPR